MSGPGEDYLGGGGEFPEVWVYWSGEWPSDDPDRCRWSPDAPWPESPTVRDHRQWGH